MGSCLASFRPTNVPDFHVEKLRPRSLGTVSGTELAPGHPVLDTPAVTAQERLEGGAGAGAGPPGGTLIGTGAGRGEGGQQPSGPPGAVTKVGS